MNIPYLLILGIGFIIFQQIALKPFRAIREILMPLIIVYFAINSIYKAGYVFDITAVLVLLAAAGIISGIISGLFASISKDSIGKALTKGGYPAVIFPLAMIAAVFAIKSIPISLSGSEILDDMAAACLIPVSFQLALRGITIFLRLLGKNNTSR